MKTLTTKEPKQKWLLPLERLYIGDKAPAYMYLAPNIWCQFKDPMQKRIILAPTIIMDVCYQDMLGYSRRYKPKQKERQTRQQTKNGIVTTLFSCYRRIMPSI